MRLKDGNRLWLPDEFIPAVLRQRLGAKMDRAVVLRAAQELGSLRLPTEFKIAINFFPETFFEGVARDLLDENFVHFAQNGCRICVEITEQQVSGPVLPEINSIKKNGYRIAVDDFGTGFSNLASVRSLAPHYLKIDRSFVWSMEEMTVRSSLIPEIVQIARAVGAQLIAEGVENEHQVEQLKALGVEYAQGYFFSKPIPVKEFSDMVSAEPEGCAST